MDNIKVKSLGPIKDANINFGDLTLFVGPQASGKSILLQLIKLINDRFNIQKIVEQYGYIWGKDINSNLDRFFGEGMSEIWNDNTSIHFDKKPFTKSDIIEKRGRKDKSFTKEESLFYIPAQRVVCLQNGWPRFFTDYEDSVPYVLRYFSETLRQFLENGKNDTIFPQSQRLKEPLRDSFNDSIFHDGKIILDKSGKKRFKLEIGKSNIPFMAWSAGQKEFMPLLLSFYLLCPPSKVSRKDDIKYVIIEEPEMGLHPQAIESVILQIIDLLSRDYKVIVSTHSPVLLEFAWAIRFLKESNMNSDSLFELFNLTKNPSLVRIFRILLEKKSLFTYYFDREHDGVSIKDISSLDAGSEDSAISEWGGLSSFSSRASEIVSNSVINDYE
ncbi:AAA family ATPase [Emticicia fluvialis]|uniref:AAA family ATPase n=1 Tax=Emticicia fluvialis TaxID=2974474 RepID=UPI00216599A9|nr:ATP-binding protein [Emticicia fluvialis]